MTAQRKPLLCCQRCDDDDPTILFVAPGICLGLFVWADVSPITFSTSEGIYPLLSEWYYQPIITVKDNDYISIRS